MGLRTIPREQDGRHDGAFMYWVDPNQPDLPSLVQAAIHDNLASAIEMHREGERSLFAAPSSGLCVSGAAVRIIRSTRMETTLNERSFKFAVRLDGPVMELEVDQALGAPAPEAVVAIKLVMRSENPTLDPHLGVPLAPARLVIG